MEAPKKKTSLVIPILILIILIGVVILSQRKPPELSIKEQAWGACELLIPKKLKAPSTAKFERYNENQVRMLSDTEYSVTIAVDAQNSFGAMIRTNFLCQVADQGDAWKLIALVELE